MGGFGSGRDEYATTPTVEDCRPLSIDTIKAFTEHTGARGPVWWGDRVDPAATITVIAEGDAGVEDAPRPDRIRLKYTITEPRTDEQRKQDYCVPLEYTACNFGGHRPWFRCPGVVNNVHCNERVGKLYKPPRQNLFLCRHCYDLGYTTSRTSGDEMKQAELRFRRIYAKIDDQGRRPHPNNWDVPHIPDRPTGMHIRTYVDLVRDLEQARQDWNAAWDAELRQLASGLCE